MPLIDPFLLKTPDPVEDTLTFESGVIPGGVLSIRMRSLGRKTTPEMDILNTQMQRKYVRSEDNPNPVTFVVQGDVIPVDGVIVYVAAMLTTMQAGPEKYTFDQMMAWIIQFPEFRDAGYSFCVELNKRYGKLMGKPEAGTEPSPGTVSPSSTITPSSSSEETSSPVPATESLN